MKKLPRSLEFLRPILHTVRNLLRALIGVDAIRHQPLPEHYSVELPVGEAFQRVMDRISILESQVNWRLYGMPASVGNIKLEQAAILANSCDLERLLDDLAPHVASAAAPDHLRAALASTSNNQSAPKNLYVVDPAALACAPQSENALFIYDSEDLFLPVWKKHGSKPPSRVEAPVLSVLAAQSSESAQLIWLADTAERLPPLKQLLTLRHAWRVLAPGGVLAGVFASDSARPTKAALDPRWLRPFAPELLKKLLPELAAMEWDTEEGTFKINKQC
jgi:hypothetical protein